MYLLFVCYLNEETLKGKCWILCCIEGCFSFFSRNTCHLFIVLYHNETTQYLSTSLRFIFSTVTMNWASHTQNTRLWLTRLGQPIADVRRVQYFCSSCQCFVFSSCFFFFFQREQLIKHFAHLTFRDLFWTIASASITTSVTSCSQEAVDAPGHERVMNHESGVVSFHFAKFSQFSTNSLRSKSPLCGVIQCLLSLKWCIENVLFLVIQELCIKKPSFWWWAENRGYFYFLEQEKCLERWKQIKGYYFRAELWRSLGGIDSKCTCL